MPAYAGTGGWFSDQPPTGRRFCSSTVKHPLEAKAHHAMPPAAGRGEVLLHRVMCLTPWVSK